MGSNQVAGRDLLRLYKTECERVTVVVIVTTHPDTSRAELPSSLDKFVDRVPSAVTFFEDLRSDHAAWVNQHGTGVRQAIFVVEAKRLDCLAAFVRK
jgi:hypothetical protein